MTFLIILGIICIFTALVEVMTFVHELGHFMVAKFNNATVVEFAVGFGPALYQKKVGDTTYSIRILPFGGYVAVLSDDIVQSLEKLKTMELTPQQAVTLTKQLKGFDKSIDWLEKPTIDKVSAPRKVWFSLMGLIMNFFMLWAILFVTYASAGKKMDDNTMYILPRAVTLSETTYVDSRKDADYEVIPNLLPFHKTTEDKKSYPLYSKTAETDQNSGDAYYDAIMNEIEEENKLETSGDGWSVWANSYQITNISYVSLDKEETTLTYTETEKVSSTAGNFQWGPGQKIKFDYLVKYEKLDKEGNSTNKYSYWLFSKDSVLSSSDSTNESLIKPSIDKPTTEYIKSSIVIPIATSSGNMATPIPSLYFGVIDDYETMGFGKSIYLSLEDSFIYLGKGFVVLFDILTFGLVIDQGNPHMYANNNSIYTATSGLWWGNITFVMLVWMSYLMIVFNILPFPPLDGWHAFAYSYEGIKKKKVSQKTTALVFKIGMALFFIVIIGGILFGL